MANLGYSSKLQIIIVPDGKTYNTSSFTTSDWEGKIIFKEGSKTILVNGNEYGVDSTELGVIINALKNSGYLTEDPSTHVLSAQNPGSVSALLGLGAGTKIATASGEGVNTVSGWISSITGDIAAINTAITNLQTNVANAKTVVTGVSGASAGTNNYVMVDKSTGTGSTPDTYTVKTTAALETAIANAESNAIATAKEDLLGTGAVSGSTSVLNPNEGDNNVWLHGEEQTLSHLKELINMMSGGDLAEVQAAIAAIKAELNDTDGDTGDLASTLIDKLSGFFGGVEEWTVNGATGVSTVAAIISNLESAIANAKTTVQGVQNDNYISVAKTTTGTGSTPDTYTIQSTTGLSNAISNAKTVVEGVSGASTGTNNYVMVDKSTGTGSTPDTYTVKTTAALDTAISNAKTTITEATGVAAGSVNYVRVEKSTNGNDTYTIKSTNALETAIASAQSNAEATALGYANQVVSWTVVS